jgi:hypothetical protein
MRAFESASSSSIGPPPDTACRGTEHLMTSASITIISPYERRVSLVAEALRTNSELSEDAAHALAVHALSALDHIPEVIR